VKLVTQRAEGDCGIAAMATLLELEWEDLYLAAACVDDKRRGKSGLSLKSMIAIGTVLGVTFKGKRKPINLDTDEGILNVDWDKRHKYKYSGHYVVLGLGVIVDPHDGSISDPEEYLASRGGRLGTLLEVR
jgi:hypothetical protein